MPIKKWILQGLVALPALFVLFAAVQYLKGRSLEYSLEFAVLWSFISVTIFFASRVYYYKKGMACRVCDDLPPREPRDN